MPLYSNLFCEFTLCVLVLGLESLHLLLYSNLFGEYTLCVLALGFESLHLLLYSNLFGEYTLCVGAGIGVTPFASILRSIW